VVRDTLGNELLGREIDSVAEKVKRGESLAEPLGESGYFPPLLVQITSIGEQTGKLDELLLPPLLVQITSIGEQTGKLDELLLNAAETFDSEADSAINRFMAICDKQVYGDLPGFVDIAVSCGGWFYNSGHFASDTGDAVRGKWALTNSEDRRRRTDQGKVGKWSARSKDKRALRL